MPRISIWNQMNRRVREFGWVVLVYSLYSSDLAQSDYYLLLSMANVSSGEKFASRETCKISMRMAL